MDDGGSSPDKYGAFSRGRNNSPTLRVRAEAGVPGKILDTDVTNFFELCSTRLIDEFMEIVGKNCDLGTCISTLQISSANRFTSV